MPGPQQGSGDPRVFTEACWLEGEKAAEGLPDPHPSHSAPSRSGRADLAAIYYERIDVEGHHYGPSSPQRKDALKAVDTVLKYMTTWIQVTGDKDHEAELPSCQFLPASLAVISPQRLPSRWSWRTRPAPGWDGALFFTQPLLRHQGIPCFTTSPAGLKWPDWHPTWLVSQHGPLPNLVSL